MRETEAGSAQFAYARYRLLSRLLAAARAGTLDPGWRERLTVDVIHEREVGGGPEWMEFFEQVTGRSYVEEKAKDNDAEVLALHEIVSSPVAAWEPYVTNGDWRRALDAWYAAAIELRDYYEDAQLRHRKAIADRLRRTQLEELRSKLKAATDEFWAEHYAKQINKAEACLLKYVEPHSPSDELYSQRTRRELPRRPDRRRRNQRLARLVPHPRSAMGHPRQPRKLLVRPDKRTSRYENPPTHRGTTTPNRCNGAVTDLLDRKAAAWLRARMKSKVLPSGALSTGPAVGNVTEQDKGVS